VSLFANALRHFPLETRALTRHVHSYESRLIWVYLPHRTTKLIWPDTYTVMRQIDSWHDTYTVMRQIDSYDPTRTLCVYCESPTTLALKILHPSYSALIWYFHCVSICESATTLSTENTTSSPKPTTRATPTPPYLADKFKSRLWITLNVYRGIWVVRWGRFWGCRICRGMCDRECTVDTQRIDSTQEDWEHAQSLTHMYTLFYCRSHVYTLLCCESREYTLLCCVLSIHSRGE